MMNLTVLIFKPSLGDLSYCVEHPPQRCYLDDLREFHLQFRLNLILTQFNERVRKYSLYYNLFMERLVPSSEIQGADTTPLA